jgi:hypothetical protein
LYAAKEQALKVYDGLQERIADYDRKILEKLGEMTREERRGQQAPELKNKEKARCIRRRGEEPLRDHWRRRMHLPPSMPSGLGRWKSCSANMVRT